MGTSTTHVDLPGSERQVFRHAKRGKPIAPTTRFEVTVRVRRPAIPAERIHPPKNTPHLTHKEFEARHGAKDTDLAAVVAFAARFGLVVVEQRKASGTVILSGSVAQFQRAFDVELDQYEHDHGTYRGRVGFVRVPADLKDVIVGVFGLDNRPFARPHNLRAKGTRAGEATSFNPQDLAALYSFPTGVTGAGQTIGIIELGGGYRPADLTTYFKTINVTVTGTLTTVSVDNGANSPGGDADAEVMLDIEVASAVAPGANVAVYFTPDTTDKSFLDAVDTAVHDQTNLPTVISISWGGPETGATDSFSTQMDESMQAAAALGITVCVASGDNGAADEGPNEWDGLAHADSPASSPHVLAVGGTRILAQNGARQGEQVWNQDSADTEDDSFGSSGGGISEVFPVPSWQSQLVLPPSVNAAAGPGRGVPDVAADADPASGYNVRVDGKNLPIGGTSAAAPLWAALIALVNQQKGRRVGFVNPNLYAAAGGPAFNPITGGNNKVGTKNVGYAAGAPWNACTGLGTPNGLELAKLF
jgi:kumamolisin